MAIKRLPSTGDAPRSTGVPESLVPGGDADSAGFPWAGRSFTHHETAFAGDDGETPGAYAAAIRALRVAAAGDELTPLAEAHAEALLALSSCRVLVPLVAEAGDLGVTPEGKTVEKTQELSIVTVASPDGRRAMPVFSSVAAMRAWNAEARPIPVPMPQAAIAAAQEQTDLIVVDAGSEELEFGVRRTQLEAVALGARLVPSWADRPVQAAFLASVERDPRVSAISLAPGDPESRLRTAEVVVSLTVVAGLAREELSRLIAELQQRWSLSEAIASRVDSLRVVIR